MLLLVFVLTFPVAAQEEDPVTLLYDLVNQARLGSGWVPYGVSTELTAAAQRHADDLAGHRLISHIGSDGSRAPQRIAEAGYAAWGNGQEVGEAIWSGTGTVQEAFEGLMADPAQQESILSQRYREMGAGVAYDAAGRMYVVLTFGARPNVLPIFINDGQPTTESPQVALRLSNEEAYPQGEGTIFIGRAVEIRVSNTPDFEAQPWQRWEPLVAWDLPEEVGEHTVYVQFRDGAGRTTVSAATITLVGEGGEVPPSPSPAPVVTAVSPTPVAETPAPALPPLVTPEPLPSPTVPPVPTPTPMWLPGGWTAEPAHGEPGTDGLVVAIVLLHLAALLLAGSLALQRHPGRGEEG
jgi:hypothetical protein